MSMSVSSNRAQQPQNLAFGVKFFGLQNLKPELREQFKNLEKIDRRPLLVDFPRQRDPQFISFNVIRRIKKNGRLSEIVKSYNIQAANLSYLLSRLSDNASSNLTKLLEKAEKNKQKNI